ncbi:hypothetical protein BKA62DRAFT_417773 [Auriculariales sp. MPI-PUGE-AT-0066]|nr:hypothetical protein BKA62DRAFT_417773 [Auriculariales sp. MPI-PUGE-AT-0066]
MTPVSPMPDQVSFRPHQTHFHQQSYAATPESERKTYFAPARSRQSVSPAISEGELQQRMFDGTGPRPQSSGHLEAMMDAAEKRQSLSRSPGLATEAALHRLFQDAPGVVQRVGAGFTNVTPSKTTKENFLSIISAAKSATQRLHKPEQERKRSHNKFFTSPDKDKRHVNPALADPQLNSTISGGQHAGGLHALVGRVAPDTTFDADDFAMVDHADSPHGTPNGKGGTIVRRAFKAFNNSMTLGRRMNKAV